MIVDRIVEDCIWLLGFRESDEFHGTDSALMEQLEETVLSIGARLSKIDYGCLVIDDFSMRVHSFSVAFHVQLLDVGCELAKCLTIRNYRS